MKFIFIIAWLFISFNITANTEISNHIHSSKLAIKQLSQSLQKEMKRAMISGGPIKAIKVCNTKALPITESINQYFSGDIKRVSFKPRNINNAPYGWEKKVLKQFIRQQQTGAAINSLIYSEVIEESDGKYFRMLKAIPTSEPCLVCHGKNIAPQLANKISALYPKDKATGYAVNDIRGAFSIKKKL